MDPPPPPPDDNQEGSERDLEKRGTSTALNKFKTMITQLGSNIKQRRTSTYRAEDEVFLDDEVNLLPGVDPKHPDWNIN